MTSSSAAAKERKLKVGARDGAIGAVDEGVAVHDRDVVFVAEVTALQLGEVRAGEIVARELDDEALRRRRATIVERWRRAHVIERTGTRRRLWHAVERTRPRLWPHRQHQRRNRRKERRPPRRRLRIDRRADRGELRGPRGVDQALAIEAADLIRIGDVDGLDQALVVADARPLAIARRKLIGLRGLERAGDLGHLAVDVPGEVVRRRVAQRARALLLAGGDVADPAVLQRGHDAERHEQHDGDDHQAHCRRV